MLKKMASRLPAPAFKFLLDIRRNYLSRFYAKSWSLEGEDMILRRIFENKKSAGFYVDVGAHHPKKYSNTYHFYRMGWMGINLDAMPGSMKKFYSSRSRDINLEIPIAENEQTLTYYMFNEPALNGFSKSLSESRNGIDGYHIEATTRLTTRRLDDILGQHLPPKTKIDFMSIDTEGFDLQVLQSNNWIKYRPTIILLEILGKEFDALENALEHQFLYKQGYKIISKALNTVFYQDKKNNDEFS